MFIFVKDFSIKMTFQLMPCVCSILFGHNKWDIFIFMDDFYLVVYLTKKWLPIQQFKPLTVINRIKIISIHKLNSNDKIINVLLNTTTHTKEKKFKFWFRLHVHLQLLLSVAWSFKIWQDLWSMSDYKFFSYEPN